MFRISAAAYVDGRFQAALVREESGTTVVARLTIPCAASFHGKLSEAAEDQIRSLTGHAFRLHAMSTLDRVFPADQIVYPSEASVLPAVAVEVTEHHTEAAPISIARATVELELHHRGNVLLARVPKIDLLDMYPADWRNLLDSVQNFGHNPYEVESVLAFLRSISHDQADMWMHKVSSFRDSPRAWTLLVMREFAAELPTEKLVSPTGVQRHIRG